MRRLVKSPARRMSRIWIMGGELVTATDYQNWIKLTQSFNCIHFIGGYPVEPVDLHASTRHLDCLFDMLTLTDNSFTLIRWAWNALRMRWPWSELRRDWMRQVSPRHRGCLPISTRHLRLSMTGPMLDGAMRLAKQNQLVIVTPFTLAGAMAPITLAGAIAQQTAECLAAIVLLQLVQPGAPVAYGSFTSNVDMKSGAPAFGTPEYCRATQMSGQMARYYDLPWRASNANAANCVDAQATWESASPCGRVLAPMPTSSTTRRDGWRAGSAQVSRSS